MQRKPLRTAQVKNTKAIFPYGLETQPISLIAHMAAITRAIVGEISLASVSPVVTVSDGQAHEHDVLFMPSIHKYTPFYIFVNS